MIRIALLSDIHFGLFSRAKEFSVPGEVIQDNNEGGQPLEKKLIDLLKNHSVEYFFVAGDLTSTGSPQEFVLCEKKLVEIAQKVGVDVSKIICGMGNHDVDRRIAQICDHQSYQNNEWSEEIKSLIKEKYLLIAANCAQISMEKIPLFTDKGPVPYSGIVENKDFITFVLNTGWLCSHEQTIEHGKLSEQQLVWFKDQAVKFKEDPRIKIVLMHHHAFQFPYPVPELDVSQIEENAEFLNIVGENGINLVLHGHRHHPSAMTTMRDYWLRPVTFICAGSLSVNAKHRNSGEIPNTVHILNISGTAEECIIDLYNYKFTNDINGGWKPIERSGNMVPVNAKMRLGKVFDEIVIKNAVLKYQDYSGELQLNMITDPCLAFFDEYRLLEVFKQYLSDTHSIITDFDEEPKYMYLRKR